jgi:hypothetical protein
LRRQIHSCFIACTNGCLAPIPRVRAWFDFKFFLDGNSSCKNKVHRTLLFHPYYCYSVEKTIKWKLLLVTASSFRISILKVLSFRSVNYLSYMTQNFDWSDLGFDTKLDKNKLFEGYKKRHENWIHFSFS